MPTSVITDGTWGRHYDNPWCHQWGQSWYIMTNLKLWHFIVSLYLWYWCNDHPVFNIGSGGIRQRQAITWANIDPELCHHTASLGHNELIIDSIYIITDQHTHVLSGRESSCHDICFATCTLIYAAGSDPDTTGIIVCMRPANERRRYIVTSSLIGWAHTQNIPDTIHMCCICNLAADITHIIARMWALLLMVMKCFWRVLVTKYWALYIKYRYECIYEIYKYNFLHYLL